MAILLGLLSTALVVGLCVVTDAYLGFGVHSMYIVFIVPAGAMCAGLVGSVGHAFGLLWTNRRLTARQCLVGGALAIAGWIAIYVSLYSLTYVTEDVTGQTHLNYSFQGEHISQYATEGGDPVTFWVYLEDAVVSRQYSFFHHGAKMGTIGDSQPVPFLNWILFSLEGIGFFIGGFGAVRIVLGDRRYCDQCELYMKRQHAMAYPMAEHEHLVQAINESLTSPTAFAGLIQSHKAKGSPKNPPYVSVDVAYCPHCRNGDLVFQFMTSMGKYGPTENTAARQIVTIRSEVVDQALNLS